MQDPYAQLRTLHDRGELSLYLLLAPPRTGSTVMARWFSRTSIDGVICEPWAKFQSGEQRLMDGYRDILTQAATLLARPGARRARRVSLLIRNPVLAIAVLPGDHDERNE